MMGLLRLLLIILVVRTRAGGGATTGSTAGLFQPVMRWLRKKIQSSARHHHIFRGEVRRGPGGTLRGSGYHHRFMGTDPPDRRVTVTRRGSNGTYAGDVEMRGPNGWLPKPGGSSFFPDNWTPQQVDRTIRDAFAGAQPVPGTGGRRWRGLSNGVVVEGSYKRNGRQNDWDSAWPIVQ
jgi:hypothetical protein